MNLLGSKTRTIDSSIIVPRIMESFRKEMDTIREHSCFHPIHKEGSVQLHYPWYTTRVQHLLREFLTSSGEEMEIIVRELNYWLVSAFQEPRQIDTRFGIFNGELVISILDIAVTIRLKVDIQDILDYFSDKELYDNRCKMPMKEIVKERCPNFTTFQPDIRAVPFCASKQMAVLMEAYVATDSLLEKKLVAEEMSCYVSNDKFIYRVTHQGVLQVRFDNGICKFTANVHIMTPETSWYDNTSPCIRYPGPDVFRHTNPTEFQGCTFTGYVSMENIKMDRCLLRDTTIEAESAEITNCTYSGKVLVTCCLLKIIHNMRCRSLPKIDVDFLITNIDYLARSVECYKTCVMHNADPQYPTTLLVCDKYTPRGALYRYIAVDDFRVVGKLDLYSDHIHYCVMGFDGFAGRYDLGERRCYLAKDENEARQFSRSLQFPHRVSGRVIVPVSQPKSARAKLG